MVEVVNIETKDEMEKGIIFISLDDVMIKEFNGLPILKNYQNWRIKTIKDNRESIKWSPP